MKTIIQEAGLIPVANPSLLRMKNLLLFVGFLNLIVYTSSAQQEEFSATDLEFFESTIRPSLIKYCYECHSQQEKSSRGGLLLDTREAILLAGDNGPLESILNFRDKISSLSKNIFHHMTMHVS